MCPLRSWFCGKVTRSNGRFPSKTKWNIPCLCVKCTQKVDIKSCFDKIIDSCFPFQPPSSLHRAAAVSLWQLDGIWFPPQCVCVHIPIVNNWPEQMCNYNICCLWSRCQLWRPGMESCSRICDCCLLFITWGEPSTDHARWAREKSMALTLELPGSVNQWADSRGPLWPIRGLCDHSRGLGPVWDWVGNY